MAKVESTASAEWIGIYELVIKALEDEHDKLFALAEALARALAPPIEGDQADDAAQPTTAWRLAQLLEERLSKTTLEDFIAALMLPKAKEAVEVRHA